jgi:hypothetical protein
MAWTPSGIYLGNDRPFDPDKPVIVKAKAVMNYGVAALVGTCPQCGYRFGLTRAGQVKGWCRMCDLWVQFVE